MGNLNTLFSDGSHIAEPASRQAHECSVKIVVLLWPYRTMQRSEALDLFLVGGLAQTQTERHRRLALATGFGSQAVWNRSIHR
jgi:hypothetical protein